MLSRAKAAAGYTWTQSSGRIESSLPLTGWGYWTELPNLFQTDVPLGKEGTHSPCSQEHSERRLRWPRQPEQGKPDCEPFHCAASSPLSARLPQLLPAWIEPTHS